MKRQTKAKLMAILTMLSLVGCKENNVQVEPSESTIIEITEPTKSYFIDEDGVYHPDESFIKVNGTAFANMSIQLYDSWFIDRKRVNIVPEYQTIELLYLNEDFSFVRMANGTVDSCVVAGELKGNGLVSGLIGMTVTKPTQKLEIIKCYNASNESRLYDTALQKPTAREVKNVSLEQLKGTQAYTYTLLDFYDAQRNTNAKWVLVENQIPELKSFAKATYVADLGSLQGIARPIVADTSWYNTTDKKFTKSKSKTVKVTKAKTTATARLSPA